MSVKNLTRREFLHIAAMGMAALVASYAPTPTTVPTAAPIL